MKKDWAVFFFAFSRFEFAMKAGEFGYKKHGRYQPNWGKYTKNAPKLPDDPKLTEAIQYLTDTPPKVQTGKATWEDSKVDKGLAGALDAARIVRNNLFHGGKWGDDDANNRNMHLVRYALYVIEACAQHDQRISGPYFK